MTELGLALPTPAPARSRARRRAHTLVFAIAVWAVVAVNAGVVTWLWLRGGGVSAVHTWGDLATSTGRVTGLLGAYFALVQVLLLARLPWLERLTGFDRLTVWHRRNGKLTLYLVLAHVVLITIGYASMDRIGVPSEISRLLSSYPGMITATVGTALMIVVVISSLVIVRRRLPYEWWYAVHFTAYAAIALSWFHEIPTGNELTIHPVAADYWRSLFLATLALLVLFRVVQPVARSFAHGLRVEEVVVEGPGRRLAADRRPPARAPARAGRAVLPLALPLRARPLVGGAPVLALRAARRAARCGSRSRASAPTRAGSQRSGPGRACSRKARSGRSPTPCGAATRCS